MGISLIQFERCQSQAFLTVIPRESDQNSGSAPSKERSCPDWLDYRTTPVIESGYWV